MIIFALELAYIWPDVQSGEMYFAAFYISSAPLLAGLDYNISSNGLEWLETAAEFNTVREDVAGLIVKHEFFRHLTVKKRVSLGC